MNTLSVFINDQLVFEYDRSTELDDKQQTFLDKMDLDMQRGLKIDGELITGPDSQQKATFVAMNLVRALQQEDHVRINVNCAYLSSRLPNVVEVQARDQGECVGIEFVEVH